MDYKTFIENIISVATGITYSGTTGTTIVKYCEFMLVDEPELDPQTKYPAVFITPIPMSVSSSPMDGQFRFNARIYVLDYIALDRSLRLNAFSKCMDILILLRDKLEDNYYWAISEPSDFIPVLYFDANVDGGFMDLSVLAPYDCI